MEKRRMLESKPCEGLKNGTHIDVEVYYTQGGANYLSGGTTPRGYYLSVTPVTRKDNMVSFTLFSGQKKLLMQTNRYSAKQFEQAVALGRSAALGLIDKVIEKENAA